MITENTLIQLIDKYEDILRLAESFGYINLRLFCSYYEEDKHKLNFLASFDSTKRQAITHNKDINNILSELLDTEVCLWGEGSLGLKSSDYSEATNAPLLNMEKTINYFIDTLVPYSTDEEPIEQSRIHALQYWQSKTVTKTQTTREEYYHNAGFQMHRVGQFQARIPLLIQQLSEELSSLSQPEKGRALLILINKNGFSLKELQQLLENLETSKLTNTQPTVAMTLSDS